MAGEGNGHRVYLPSSNGSLLTGLCSSRARWPLAPNFCPRVTFHTNHMLGTLDFAVSEHWASFNFPYSPVFSMRQLLSLFMEDLNSQRNSPD